METYIIRTHKICIRYVRSVMDRNLVGSDDWKYIRGSGQLAPRTTHPLGTAPTPRDRSAPAEDKSPVKIIPPSTLYYRNDRQIIIILYYNYTII